MEGSTYTRKKVREMHMNPICVLKTIFFLVSYIIIRLH